MAGLDSIARLINQIRRRMIAMTFDPESDLSATLSRSDALEDALKDDNLDDSI
jgi:hypothetical protein